MIPALFGLSGPVLTADERACFREAEPAGYIVYGRNVRDPAQLRALTDALRSLSGRAELPILIDQEGGRVARLGPPHWPSFPAQARFGGLYALAPISAMEAARVNAQAIALVLREAGINVGCLPVLDLAYECGHPVIGARALGSDPMPVAALGRAVLDGLAEGGVAGVIKHMPGHGRAAADSHRTLPHIGASAEELDRDLAPFRSLAGRARFGMTAHLLYAAWDADRPATLSPEVIGTVIRGRIGFEGLLMSDDIAMGALSGALGERATAALAAGCDLILHCSGRLTDAEEIAAALPPMSKAMEERLAAALHLPATEGAPLQELLAKRAALLALGAAAN